MEHLHIGLMCDSFFPMIDGVVMVVDNYARRLQKYGDVTVFVPGTEQWFTFNGSFPYPVVYTRALRLPVIDYALPVPTIDPRYRSALLDTKLDLVHIHSPMLIGKSGVRYGKRFHVPTVATMHSQFRRDIQRAVRLDMPTDLLLKYVISVFNNCDECWAVNAAIAEIFRSYGYRTLPKIQENGTEMRPVADMAAACRRVNETYNIHPEENVFLFVGRLNKLKNVMMLADSLAILRDKGVPYKMFFVGSGQDEEELHARVASYNLNDRVIFTGRIKDRELLSSIYARAHLFLFPSLYDASSLVQIEAASQKTPGVFVEGAATADTVTAGVNGYTAPGDATGYAGVIEKILSDKQALSVVSENAFRDLYRHWDDIVDNVYGRYLDIKHTYDREHMHRL